MKTRTPLPIDIYFKYSIVRLRSVGKWYMGTTSIFADISDRSAFPLTSNSDFQLPTLLGKSLLVNGRTRTLVNPNCYIYRPWIGSSLRSVYSHLTPKVFIYLFTILYPFDQVGGCFDNPTSQTLSYRYL